MELKHKNIIGFKDYAETKENLYIIMEHQDKDLKTYFKDNPE